RSGGTMRHLSRHVGSIFACLSLTAAPLAAQTGTIRGTVTDSVTQQGLPGVSVQILGTTHPTATGADGNFALTDVPAGTVTLKVTRIGYGPQQRSVTVAAGATADEKFSMAPQASILEPVVVTGYGSQRREAITGSVSTIEATQANVGVKTNFTQMIQGRAAGVDILPNKGEPGAGGHDLIRRGRSD